jgi:hypothetical protein
VNAQVAFHASDSLDQEDNGDPLGLDFAGCGGPTDDGGGFSCRKDRPFSVTVVRRR